MRRWEVFLHNTPKKQNPRDYLGDFTYMWIYFHDELIQSLQSAVLEIHHSNLYTKTDYFL